LALLTRVAVVAVAADWLAYEWRRWPNGSAMLGPLGLVWYNGPTVGNLAYCAVGLALVLAYPMRPGALTAALSAFGLLLWVFLGVMAEGIGC
jgi:hypothetical protein